MKQQSRTNKQTGLWIITYLLIICSVVLSILTFVKLDPFDKFGKNDNNPPIVEENPIDNSFLVKPQSTKSMRLASGPAMLAANGTTVVRVTATVLPETAPQEVDWSLSFANPSSTWANGKNVTDYVTVTPTADGAKTADVAVVAPFGEQIILTVTSRDNTEKTATVDVDYAVRYSFMDFDMSYIAPGTGEGAYRMRFRTNMTAGTVENTVRSIEFHVKNAFLKNVWSRFSNLANDDTVRNVLQKYENSANDIVMSSSRAANEAGSATIDFGVLPIGIDNGYIVVSEEFGTTGNLEKGFYNLLGFSDEQYASLSKSTKNALNTAITEYFTQHEDAFYVVGKIQSPSYANVEQQITNCALVGIFPKYVDSVSTDIPSIIF